MQEADVLDKVGDVEGRYDDRLSRVRSRSLGGDPARHTGLRARNEVWVPQEVE
jgi:hypothetical protein